MRIASSATMAARATTSQFLLWQGQLGTTNQASSRDGSEEDEDSKFRNFGRSGYNKLVSPRSWSKRQQANQPCRGDKGDDDDGNQD